MLCPNPGKEESKRRGWRKPKTQFAYSKRVSFLHIAVVSQKQANPFPWVGFFSIKWAARPFLIVDLPCEIFLFSS